jgi:Na+/glutamate symporter
MTKIEIAKKAVSLTVGFGTSAIVASIIKNNAVPGNTAEKVAMPVAQFVLAMMVSDVTKRYTDVKSDEAVAWYNENVKN